MLLEHKRCILGLCLAYCKCETLSGHTMLEVEPTGQRGPMTTGSGRNGLDLKNLRCRYLLNEDK